MRDPLSLLIQVELAIHEGYSAKQKFLIEVRLTP